MQLAVPWPMTMVASRNSRVFIAEINSIVPYQLDQYWGKKIGSTLLTATIQFEKGKNLFSKGTKFLLPSAHHQHTYTRTYIRKQDMS